ncbi:MAG TPA: hypothetical protein VMS60_05670 [Solirubrobacterales bacterium]|nr:hypothetical protein [Solirubrobacterales bacterium]
MDATHPAAAAGAAAAGKQQEKADEQVDQETWNDRVKTVAGLTAVIVGVIMVGLVAIVAMLKGGENSATIASSAAGVIATIVGAYFGVKMGNDQTKDAAKSQKATAAKAEVYAAHLDSTDAKEILAQAETAARRATKA